MKQICTAPAVPSKAPSDPVCRTVPLRRLPGVERSTLACCSIPTDEPARLKAAMKGAPQFARVEPDKLLSRAVGGALRVILVGEHDYYLRQAAVYLTALSVRTRKDRATDGTDDFWNDPDDFADLGNYIADEEPSLSAAMKDSLVVVSPLVLDPALAQISAPAGSPGAMAAAPRELKQLRPESLDSAALLIAASTGAVLTPGVLDSLEPLLDAEKGQDIFIATKGGQADSDLVEELRFRYGFQICRVGQADRPYLRRVLNQLAKDNLMTFPPTFDPDTVLSQLRRYRGARFEESDLEILLQRAARLKGKRGLGTADLLMHPWRSQSTQSRQALDAMIGLDGVKAAVRRLLAAAVLEDRRRLAGVEIPPTCRNLAFSGPPGTGKSVTARLIARILREEGCGSGRFVEAGREQLIGPYLGQTSPMIAELFRQAKGGVLFIDEAGALLNEGHDTYAVEAVNALVRHMELEPETMVIFATYPGEMKKLLSSNPGLSSRVAQVLDFTPYEDGQLVSIFQSFAHQEQLELDEGVPAVCENFFHQLRLRKGPDFGNGREARRLFQAAKEELALRTAELPDADPVLSAADLKEAALRLLAQEEQPSSTPIGFHR